MTDAQPDPQAPPELDPDRDPPDAPQDAADEEFASDAADQGSELPVLAEELDAARERELRARAELDNFRKRIFRQLEEERKYAAMPLVRDLLMVVDNLDRAIRAAEENHDAASLLDGVKMVAEQLSNVLSQHSCTPIASKGQTFDPHLHEAIAQQPSQEYPAGTVVEEASVGYQLHDRVVRPSQVLVSTGPPEE
jgi:molecular chaperone GrpE